ncbi:MAG: gamma carbonic anhydrase family protein [Rhodothalassiaceae bacterium]
MSAGDGMEIGGGTLYAYRGTLPTLGRDVFIAPGARVIGDVAIGDRSSIWFNCVVRGDVNRIRIGTGSNIQDGSVVHVTHDKWETVIGDHVLIGHMAMIHGCTIEDHAFVGLGAVVMDGCVIESDGMLAAGALLPPGKRIGPGELWVGRPARLARRLGEDEIAMQRMGAPYYAELAGEYLRAARTR